MNNLTRSCRDADETIYRIGEQMNEVFRAVIRSGKELGPWLNTTG
jgi:hypothetical protein